MQTPIAYLVVLFVWSTTPLAIKLSNTDTTPAAAVAVRMSVAFALGLLLAVIFRKTRFFDSKHGLFLFVASLGLFPNMPLVYEAANYIPSGLISVIFALSPFLTAFFSWGLLKERRPNSTEWVALLLAFFGVGMIFHEQVDLGTGAETGIALMVVSVCLFSLSSVLVKKLGTGELHPFEQTVGSLGYALPGFLLYWYFQGGAIPQLTSTSGFSIGYLAVFGSLLSFVAWFHLIEKITMNQLFLIPLITPVFALLVGIIAIGESVGVEALVGSLLVVFALGLFHQGQSQT